jgi:NADH-quinone oxidoreductase subunit F
VPTPGTAGVSPASSRNGAVANETPALPGERPETRPPINKGGSLTAEELISLIDQSGLRGRGGAGFSTSAKWRLARQQSSETKYVICNGDEGDPGAFMDRMLLESFPYRIIEGLALAAVAIGAHDGIFYIRHEYPLAVRRIRAALKICVNRGWLGERLLGSDYALRMTIKEGAGAFICGEETALIASIEGQRGMPRLRPPFPAQEGLWNKPTVINNVETLAAIPWIVRHGPKAFAAHGTQLSKGTKVFALAGNIQRGGLIEIPMGTTIREIVDGIGGGVRHGRRFKAVQIGGPSGGCVPARLADTPVDYESLREVGAIMGSGGLVVLDDTTCMVDIARYFLQFTQDQSCGKCTFCRVGTRRMLDILDRLCAGKGQRQDLALLEQLARQVGAGSLCGLGKTAPNPVLSTLRYFREEYEAHLEGRCPAGKCAALIKYRVLDNCTGCTICAQRCPVDAIPMTPYQRHVIDLEKCTRCDSCREACPEGAIEVT